jgi:hypothetical protein
MYAWQERSLFNRPQSVSIPVCKTHELVRLADAMPWRELILTAMNIRVRKIKKATGPQPQYRQLLGAVVLMAVKNMQYRDIEDQIAYYAPARYLCDMLDSDKTMDHVTIFDFCRMLGPDGMKELNDLILKHAEEKGFLDKKVLMSDTTAQEARIPYPNESGLMARYMALTSRATKRLRGKFDTIKEVVKEASAKVKGLAKNGHLFAKTREQKKKIEKKMWHTVRKIQTEIESAVAAGANLSNKAGQELVRIHGVMKRLLPQIRHFLDTGFVAPKKILHLQMPEVYSIKRGKAGKPVEFGQKWGISRFGGGFVQGFLIGKGENRADTAFCLESLKSHSNLFDEAPKMFGFDRGGDSVSNVKKAHKMGVQHVGIAPRGKKNWAVSDRMQDIIKRERARVEGSIGTIKSARYGFNKPNVRSVRAMHQSGHRAILGFNLRKMVNLQMAATAAAG